MVWNMWHLTPDMCHVTCDMWHMICVTWHTGEDEHCVTISGPKILWLGCEGVLKIMKKGWLNKEWITEVFVEQPRLHRVCQLNISCPLSPFITTLATFLLHFSHFIKGCVICHVSCVMKCHFNSWLPGDWSLKLCFLTIYSPKVNPVEKGSKRNSCQAVKSMFDHWFGHELKKVLIRIFTLLWEYNYINIIISQSRFS